MSEAESSSTYRRGLLIDSEIRILTDFNTTFKVFSTSKQESEGQLFTVFTEINLEFLPTHDLIFIFFRVRKCWRSFTLSFISSPRWGGFLLRTPHRSHVLCLKQRTLHIISLFIVQGLPGRWHGPGGGQTQGTEHVAALTAGPLPRDEGELGAAHVAGHGRGRALVPLWAPLIVGAPTAHASWSRLGKR